LEEEIRTTPQHDVLNARVVEDNARRERVMGTQGLGASITTLRDFLTYGKLLSQRRNDIQAQNHSQNHLEVSRW